MPKNIWVAEKYMGCRIPIRQMPSGILFLKNYFLFGKSEFANPLRAWYFHILCRGFLFHPELCSPNGRTASCRFMVDGDNKVPVFFAGLKTVVNMCRSYGTFL
ncbi:MAG TPA: hypothetical protein PLL35_01125 [Candidatus Cloacimonas sp.]|nr:hypothetical protein [Candidatus Cloacimonas sp.]HQO17877.1 hypothetical protein [Candidatus Cloacimonas sp.]